MGTNASKTGKRECLARDVTDASKAKEEAAIERLEQARVQAEGTVLRLHALQQTVNNLEDSLRVMSTYKTQHSLLLAENENLKTSIEAVCTSFVNLDLLLTYKKHNLRIHKLNPIFSFTMAPALLSKLNESKCKSYMSIRDLEIGVEHPIVRLEESEQQFGRSILAHIKLKDNIVIVTLPRRYSELVSVEDLQSYTAGDDAMIFKGYKGMAYDLEFVEVASEHLQKMPRRR